jgi:eukaryotic-like serine/threonine-protein kinase
MLPAGTRLGPYEIVAFVAAGGMGEVYRARDARLDRVVAVKIVGSELAHDADARRRFEDEARLAAQLDHPRIGAVHDVGRYGDIDYFVMEFIEGESLAQRIAAGPLPMRELIGIAIEIAAALAYAHNRGVIHRDLKPGNVLLTENGVKVVDFGLGALRHGRPSKRIAALETVPLPNSDPHLVTGTAGFVPPERLQGLPTDHRADIFAFGALLYEMASGRRAFEGQSAADVIAAILTTDPPPLPDAPAQMRDIEWIVRRCLKKRPDDRWQSMADVEAVLRRIARGPLSPRGDAPLPRRDERAVWAAAAIVAAVVAGGAVLASRAIHDEIARGPLVALAIPPPPGSGFTPTEGSVQSPQFAVSPDGRSICFVASDPDGVPEIWIRPIDSTDVRPIPGTEHATYPFWSPSSRSIGFFADGDLKRIDLDGGPPRALARAPNGRGGAWAADGAILFSPDVADVIRKVTPAGDVVAQTAMSAAHHDVSHRWPQFLPDGRHFIYFARSADDRSSSIRLASLDTPDDRVLVKSGIGAIYADGYMLYVEDDVLLAVRLDVARARIVGDPVPIVDHVSVSSNFYGAFSAASGGVLAYATKASASELVWVGRDGRPVSTVARGAFVDFRLSPDQRYLAAAAVEPRSGRADLRLLDLVRGTDVRLTTSPATDASPVFSPDGSRIVFRSNRERVHDLYIRPAGAGEDRIFLRTGSAKAPTDWTRDGTLVVFHAKDDRTHYDVWAAPADHPDQAQPLVRTEFDDAQGQVSPSGRWLAYVSNESSRFEVYVQPMHGAGRRWQLSTGGGSDPKWRADEREIFYVSRDERLMAVDLGTHGEIEPGTPHPLFPLHDVAVLAPFPSVFDVRPDGQRFLIRAPIEVLQTHPLTVLVNWSPLARSRASTH